MREKVQRQGFLSKCLERFVSITLVQKGLQVLSLYPVSGPEFLVIGASKAGSTTLYALLAGHPRLSCARGVLRGGAKVVKEHNKEVRFFNRVNRMSRRTVWAYQRLFLPDWCRRGKLIFEATPNYLSSKRAPKNIRCYSAKMKLIMCLREPSERAYSQWKMFHTVPCDELHYDSRSFEEVIANKESSYVTNGLYAEHIKRYLEYFPPEQLLILDFNDLMSNQEKVMIEVSNFLGIERFDGMEVHANAGRKLPARDVEKDNLLSELREFYKPHNDDLRMLLKQFDTSMSWL